MRAPPTLLASRFSGLRFTASGGTADVFQAVDDDTGQRIAIKVLRETDSAWLDRFEREVQVLAALRHPAVVRYVGHGLTTDGRPFLATEWIEGQTLRARLAQGRMALSETLDLVQWLCEGLAEAHALGLVHRDIKPGNIILPHGGDQRGKLIDFGLIGTQAVPSTTLPGLLLGTVGYMSPEQIRNASGVDPRSDVYSMGCVLFECLTGRGPFRSDDLVGTIGKVLYDDTPRVADHVQGIPDSVTTLTARMMAKRPDDRPATAAEVAALLRGERGLPPPAGLSVSSCTRGITDRERRMLCVIFTGATYDHEPGEHQVAREQADRTMVSMLLPGAILEEIVHPFGGTVELLASNLALIALRGKGPATDHVADAARCALALRTRMAGVPMVLVTGLWEPEAPLGVGEMFDRGARMLRAARSVPATRGVRIDDVTAGLLGARFEVADKGFGPVLLREARAPTARRQLLGRPTPCVGRERELALLDGVWAECLAEPRARMVWLSGAPGIGKTRLLQEALARVRAVTPHVQVWLAEAAARTAGSPLATLRAILGSVFKLKTWEREAGQMRRIRSRVARHVSPADAPRIAAFLAETCGVRGRETIELRAARHDPALMADQTERAWVDFIGAELAARPLLIAIDDAQWTDGPTLRLLSAMVQVHRAKPLLVLAFARPAFHEAWIALPPRDLLLTQEIKPISQAASERLVRAVLPALSPDLVRHIATIAEGNAFFLEELIRVFAQGGSASDAGSILAIMQSRLESLPSSLRRVLRAASVFGDAFFKSGLLYVLGDTMSPAAVDLALHALVEQEILQPVARSGRAAWKFRHATLCDAAHMTLTTTDHELAHGLAAEWLEAHGERDGWLLANHWLAGQRHQDASRCYARAAEQALQANDMLRAIDCTERALALAPDADLQGHLLVLQAEAYRWHGQHERAAASAQQAIERMTHAHPDWPRALEECIRALARLGQREQAHRLTLQLVNWGERCAASLSTGLLQCRTALAVVALDEFDLARRLIDQAAAGASPDGPPDALLEASLAHARAVVTMRGDVHFDDYASALQQTIRAYSVVGDLRNVCIQSVNLGYVLMCVGALVPANTTLAQSIRVADTLNLHHVAAAARHNLGLVLALQGDTLEGLEIERRCAQDLAAHGDRRLEAASRRCAARILAMMGRLPEAEQEAREAVKLAAAFPATHAAAVATLAYVLAVAQKHVEALSWEPSLRQTLQRNNIENDGTAQLALALALAGTGRREDARREVQTLCTWIGKRAATLADAVQRRSYLRDSLGMAETQRLASWLGVPFPETAP